MELNRRVSTYILKQAKIENLRMPKRVREIFILLGNEKDIGVKGGHAKLLFQILLRQWGDIKGSRNCRAQGYDGAPFDIDIALACDNLSEETLLASEERTDALIEKLRGTVELKGKNIEAVQGDLRDEKFIKAYLERQDMTIDEIVAVPNNGLWTLHFTDKCKWDMINGTGILSPNGQGTIRRHNGVMIASQKGTLRLIQSLIEKKVTKIYLPQRWINTNKEETQRLFKKDLKFRENLGYYGYLTCQRYTRNKTLQVKLMKILKMLQLTDFDEDEFADFYNEQSNAVKLLNKDFYYDPDISFLENQKRLKKDRREKKESKQGAKKQIYECKHEQMETMICNGCSWKCMVSKCADCQLVKIRPGKSEFFVKDFNKLLCNQNFIKGDWYWDKQGFVYS